MEICNQDLCTGCGMCAEICPKKAITLKQNEYGYKYPLINTKKCIECNLCIDNCPSNLKMSGNYPSKAYAAWSLDVTIRKKAASGGVASIFYKKMIQNNGIGYGVYHTDNYMYMFDKVKKNDDIFKVSGSKYVASSLANVFKQINNELNNDKNVLFIGLPCQVAAIKKYFGKKLDKIILVDIICHGVPSNKYFKEHINKIINEKEITNISFREDNDFKLSIHSERKRVKIIPGKLDTYITGFKNCLFYRESCYKCLYAKPERISDITIGDFWGIGKYESFDQPYEGSVSLILVNSEKGENFVRTCSNLLYLEERKIGEAIDGNSQLRYPSLKHKNYELFKKCYLEYGFEKAALIALKDELKLQKREYYKGRLKLQIRNIIKKVIR